MPKIRVRSSKPGARGAYNQGRKLQKSRNHEHSYDTFVNTRGKVVEYCTVPKCKDLHLI